MAPSARGTRNEPRDRTEREWQFDAVDLRPVERWLLSDAVPEAVTVTSLPPRLQVDRYVDTEDRRLHRGGFSIRVRRTGDGLEATMKSLEPARGGRRERREIEQDLADADPARLASSRGPVAERVRSLAGRRPLLDVAELRTTRRPFALSMNGDDVAEIALDETEIPLGADEAPARLLRVEVESVPGDDDAAGSAPGPGAIAVEDFVRRLRDGCGLRPAVTSKLEAALLARGVPAPGAEDLGALEADDSSTVGELAFAVMRRQFEAMLAQEPGSRLGEDPEAVHDMRVAGRRLRAALSLFRDALPARAGRLRVELGWVAGGLGAVRDLDVQLEQLGEWRAGAEVEEAAALDAVVGVVRRRRVAARREMLRALDSRRYDRLVAGFTEFLQRGPSVRSPAARRPALEAVPPLIERRYRRFRKRGDGIRSSSDPAAYHRLRIRGKRLRYALEFVKPLYPAHVDDLVRALVQVQDTLGLHQDAEVAVAHLRDLVNESGPDLPPAAVFALGRVTERYVQQARGLRDGFPTVYRGVRGRPWKDLRREMRRRADADVPPARAGQPDSPAVAAPVAAGEAGEEAR